jgi:hypothetical protein
VRAAFVVSLLLVTLCASAQTDLMMQQASGTSRNPDAAPMAMVMTSAGGWSVMYHGQAFLNHVNASGPRGGHKTFSTNWFMASATRSIGGGTLGFRTMLSLEPATISGRRYPELFQTGETAFGKQLIDGQHPHEFFMELAAEYVHAIGPTTAYVYAAPVGDPSLGPVAFPHRASAMELPQAPISHHFADSTHIAYDVITAGVIAGPATIEASAFHGGEPDEKRWNIEHGRLDSWSARIRIQPIRQLDFQVSHGRLTKPETIEPGYQTRNTASISYSQSLWRLQWDSSVIWGQVYKEVHDRTLTALLAETSLRAFDRHHLTFRVERVDKDELFPHPIVPKVPRPPLPVRVFRVDAVTYGYTLDLWRALGVGANVTSYHFPPVLKGFYGSRPHSVIVFVRGRVG